MKRVRSSDPDQLVYRGGGGPLIVLGLPFAGFGLFFTWLGANEVRNGDPDAWGAALLGAVFAILGLVMILGRRGLELDLKSRTYRQWWGLIGPWRTKTGSLDSYEKVALRLEVRTQKNHRYNAYPVRLTGPGGSRLNVGEFRVYEKSRGMAAELAKSLRFPLEDSTTGTDIVRDPDHVDEPLRDRLRRENKPTVDPGSPPADMRTRFNLDGKTIRFAIPPSGIRPAHVLPLIPLVVLDLLVVFIFLLPEWNQRANGVFADKQLVIFSAVVCSMLALPFAIFGLRILARARTATIVEASPQVLRVETKTPFSSRSVEVPCDSILDVELSRAVPLGRRGQSIFEARSQRAIVVRCAARAVSFGSHLGDDEKRWIRDVIEQVVSA